MSETPATEPDTQSDPSLDDGESTDWSGEGGADTEGPATDQDAGDAADAGDADTE